MGNLYFIRKTIKHQTFRKRISSHFNHLNGTGALKELSELGAIDIEGKVTDEELEVSREGAALLRRGVVVSEHVVFLHLEIGRDGDVCDETRWVLGG